MSALQFIRNKNYGSKSREPSNSKPSYSDSIINLEKIKQSEYFTLGFQIKEDKESAKECIQELLFLSGKNFFEEDFKGFKQKYFIKRHKSKYPDPEFPSFTFYKLATFIKNILQKEIKINSEALVGTSLGISTYRIIGTILIHRQKSGLEEGQFASLDKLVKKELRDKLNNQGKWMGCSTDQIEDMYQNISGLKFFAKPDVTKRLYEKQTNQEMLKTMILNKSLGFKLPKYSGHGKKGSKGNAAQLLDLDNISSDDPDSSEEKAPKKRKESKQSTIRETKEPPKTRTEEPKAKEEGDRAKEIQDLQASEVEEDELEETDQSIKSVRADMNQPNAEKEEIKPVLAPESKTLSFSKLKKRCYETVFSEDFRELTEGDKDIISEITSTEEKKIAIKDLLKKYGVRNLVRDLNFELLKMMKEQGLDSEEKNMVKHLFTLGTSQEVKEDNMRILQRKMKEWQKQFAEDPDLELKTKILDVFFTKMKVECKWLETLMYWIFFEHLKSTEKKSKKVPINRVVILTGKTGVGKTSFVQNVLGAIFKCVPVDLKNLSYQNSQVASNNVQVFFSPDKADPREMYDFSLVINNEHPLDVKGKDPPTNCKFKSGVILSNYEKDKIRSTLEKLPEDDLWGRLDRRAFWIEMGAGRQLSDFLYASFVGMPKVELELRQFYFWTKVIAYGTSVDSSAHKKYEQEQVVYKWEDFRKFGAKPIDKQQKLFQNPGKKKLIEDSEIFMDRLKKEEP